MKAILLVDSRTYNKGDAEKLIGVCNDSLSKVLLEESGAIRLTLTSWLIDMSKGLIALSEAAAACHKNSLQYVVLWVQDDKDHILFASSEDLRDKLNKKE